MAGDAAVLREQRLLLDVLRGNVDGILASALSLKYTEVYGKLLQLKDGEGSAVPLRDLLFFHPEVSLEPCGETTFVLFHTKHRRRRGSDIDGVQRELLEVLRRRPAGCLSSLLPDAYREVFGKPLVLKDDQGRKVTMNALLRWHPDVRTTREGGNIRHQYVAARGPSLPAGASAGVPVGVPTVSTAAVPSGAVATVATGAVGSLRASAAASTVPAADALTAVPSGTVIAVPKASEVAVPAGAASPTAVSVSGKVAGTPTPLLPSLPAPRAVEASVAVHVPEEELDEVAALERFLIL